MTQAIILSVIVSLFASIVQTVTGFGYGIIVMAILPHLALTTMTWACLSGLVSVVTSVMITWRYRHKVDLKKACAPLITYFPLAFFVIRAAGSIEEGNLRKILGVSLILLSLYFIFFSKNFRIRPTLKNGMIAGSVAAVLSGLFSTGGPPIAAYLLAASDDKEEYIGNMQTYFFATAVYNSALRIYRGYVTPQVWAVSFAALLSSFIGVAIGHRVVDRIDGEKQKKYVYLLMLVSGVTLLF